MLVTKEKLGRSLYHTLLPFYRQFPTNSPVSMFHLDIRGAYSPHDRFFYNRVPKAANSTVMRRLSDLSPYKRPFSSNAKNKFLRPSFMSSKEVGYLKSDQVFCFTMVRNPYARILSAYRDKILGGSVQGIRHFGSRVQIKPPTFREFCHFLNDGGLWLDAHWAPQVDLMLLPLDRFDFIGKVESIDHDLSAISARVWGVATPPAERIGRVTSADDGLEKDYTDECREILSKLYEKDFEAFAYKA
jgi:hypothetical protein